MSEVTIVVAASDNNAIGSAGKLPWRLPEDLKRFRHLTMGKPVVMGRRTFDSIGRPLPGRRNIVVSRKACLAIEGCKVVNSPEEALEVAREEDPDEIMIIGGAQLYNELLPRTGRIQMTRVHATIEGDTFFPRLPADEWHVVWSEPHKAAADRPFAFTFQVLERL